MQQWSRVLILLAMLVTAYLLVLAWQKDYGSPANAPAVASAPVAGNSSNSSTDVPVAPVAPTAAATDIPVVTDTPAQPIVAAASANGAGLIQIQTDVYRLWVNPRGGDVVRARQVMHGKTSPITHTDLGVFEGLSHPLTVTRYHSLVVKAQTLPECLELTAWTTHEDGTVDEIMGLRHKTLNVEGVQFHPESILTEQGHELFANFLKQTGGSRQG